jgi:leader peptidase (prepilin peptidase) / N-methyltransferase
MAMIDMITFFNEHELLLLLVTICFSLLVGSFLNVVIYRLPRMMEAEWAEECRIYLGLKPPCEQDKLNLCLPMSHCPQCKVPIRPWHNIPLLSYWWLRGKCAMCHAPISLRYPLVEAITMIASCYVMWHFGLTAAGVYALLFTWIIIALTFIDLDRHLLPDQLTLLLLWIGLIASIGQVFCNSTDAILGAITGYFVFAITQAVFGLMTGKLGMGRGDFKFLAAIGAYVGWQLLPFVILFASIAGIIIALVHMLIRRQFKSTPLPFGPYLALAGWLALMFRSEVFELYMKIA